MSNPWPAVDPEIWTQSYWKESDPKQMGDDEVEEIYVCVGAALTVWENLEANLAALFMMFVQCKAETNTYKAVSRAYGSIESSAGRRKALAAAANVYFGKDWQKRKFNPLLSNL